MCVVAWESVSKHEKVCQHMRKCVKKLKSMSQDYKMCHNMVKCVKTW